MYKKILLIFAQASEANAILSHTCAMPVMSSKRETPCLYQFDKGWIVISSIGLHAAQMAVSQYAHLGDEIWNIGLAGSLKKNLIIGELLQIETVSKYVPIEEGSLDDGSSKMTQIILPTFDLKQCGSKLVSSDFPIHSDMHRERLEKKWDLVDMEGYAIAFASAYLGKKCRIWKVVSDFASPGGRSYIQRYKTQLSEKIAQAILTEFINFFA